MATAKRKIPQSLLNENTQSLIHEAVQGGLPSLSLKELLGAALSMIATSERTQYLSQHPSDTGNGKYLRELQVGSLPVEMRVPRTRSGKFRPEVLPPHYHRGFSESTRELLQGLLASSRSIHAAKASLRAMGLSVAEAELEAIAEDFVSQIELHNTRTLASDWIALFIDGKWIEIRDKDRLRKACIYVVIGLGLDGKKRVLACHTAFGDESLEEWRKVLRGLIERGVRRVMILVQDDFSGLLGLTKGLFPQTDIQLCLVHMMRNAKLHLDKPDGKFFLAEMKTIKTMLDAEQAKAKFDELCTRFSKEYPSFISTLKKKRDHYFYFLNYPMEIRSAFYTTNPVEAINNQLERMRINNGGYFHAEHTLKLKLGIVISSLEDGWKNPSGTVQTALSTLQAIFFRRFESEMN